MVDDVTTTMRSCLILSAPLSLGHGLDQYSRKSVREIPVARDNLPNLEDLSTFWVVTAMWIRHVVRTARLVAYIVISAA